MDERLIPAISVIWIDTVSPPSASQFVRRAVPFSGWVTNCGPSVSTVTLLMLDAFTLPARSTVVRLNRYWWSVSSCWSVWFGPVIEMFSRLSHDPHSVICRLDVLNDRFWAYRRNSSSPLPASPTVSFDQVRLTWSSSSSRVTRCEWFCSADAFASDSARPSVPFGGVLSTSTTISWDVLEFPAESFARYSMKYGPSPLRSAVVSVDVPFDSQSVSASSLPFSQRCSMVSMPLVASVPFAVTATSPVTSPSSTGSSAVTVSGTVLSTVTVTVRHPTSVPLSAVMLNMVSPSLARNLLVLFVAT